MKLLNIIFTYNRPKTQFAFWDTLENCTSIHADHTVVIDDKSQDITQSWLYSHCQEKGHDLLLRGKNQGYSRNYWTGYNMVKNYEPEIVSFLESDYVFRKNYMEEVMAVFEALPDCLVVKAFCHRDYYDRAKIIPWFKQATIDAFGSPLNSAENLYVEKELETTQGKIKFMYGSHSCGCVFVNWKRLREICDIEKELDPIIYKACKENQAGTVIDDGLISSAIAKIWDKKYNANSERNEESGVVFISDYSLSCHVNSGGVNHEGITEEGTSTVTVNFPQDYKNFERK